MNDLLRERILRRLESLSDERGYQVLDFVEFLESKYAARANPGGLFARITETVEDTMRAGKLPIKAISGTMGMMDSASRVMKGVAAAAQAVVDEAVRAGNPDPSALPSTGMGSPGRAPTAPPATPPAPPPPRRSDGPA